MKKELRPVVFLDRDGTIIHDRPGHYLTRPENLRVYRNAPEAIRILRKAGFKIVVVSNQSGLGRGFLDLPTLGRIHARLHRELAKGGAKIDAIYYCPHHPDADCRCRKPKPTLAKRAVREMSLSLKRAVMVGDKLADVNFARNAGISSVLVETGHGRDQRERYGKKLKPTHQTRDLLSAARWIVKNLMLVVLLALPANSQVLISSQTIPTPNTLVGSTIELPEGSPPVPFFGEKLDYEVKWGFLSMGFASMEAKEVVEFNGEPAYHLISRAKSARYADRFYKVRDINESWLRTRDLVSLGYSKKLREGKFFRDEWVVYDYPKKSWLSKRINRDGSFEYSNGELNGLVQDILSSMYSIRNKELKVGDEIIIDVNTKKTWPMVVKVLRKQRVKTPAGTFRTVLIEPMLREEGIFIQKGKRLRIWLTNDKRHIPVLIKVEIIFGHISCYLTEIHSGS